MTKKQLKAVEVFERAFQNDPKFLKDWKDYLEITITDVLEENGIESIKKIKKIRTDAAERIIALFDTYWWEMQTNI